MKELVDIAISKGAKLYCSISGGKDGDAMCEVLHKNGYAISGLIHADLGRTEWPESLPQCQKASEQLNVPLYVVKRRDGLDMLGYWQRRMHKLQGTGKPFWSSAKNRYCTSDLKRGPIDVLFTALGDDFIIDCQGIRAQESHKRAAKQPLSIRKTKTSSFYKGMTVEQAIANYTPGKKLVITWYPIFNYSLNDVWATKGLTGDDLKEARRIYKLTKAVPSWWTFHPAYAYGNERVSCIFCILGSLNDLSTGAEHHPQLLRDMIEMQEYSGATFKHNWSLEQLNKPLNHIT